MNFSPWWKGRRGEWYVVLQGFLIALLAFGPRTCASWPAWIAPWSRMFAIAGWALAGAGSLIFAAGLIRLGVNLTPLPYPKDNATLVVSGPYRLVRHPIYSGGIILAFGWALAVNGWLTLLYAIVLLVFFDIKSRREERWLCERFAEYPEYQKRVKKLVPFIY